MSERNLMAKKMSVKIKRTSVKDFRDLEPNFDHNNL